MPEANKKTAYSVGVGNIPNQIHELAGRTGIEFNVMCLGDKKVGKKMFLKTIFGVDVCGEECDERCGDIKRWEHVIVENGFHLKLGVAVTSNIRETESVSGYIEKEMKQYLKGYTDQRAEMAAKDGRVHLFFYFFSVHRRRLSEKALKLLEKIGKMTNLIVVVPKGDILTENEKKRLFRDIRGQLTERSIRLYENTFQQPVFSVSGEKEHQVAGHERSRSEIVHGRKYSWGTVDSRDPNLYSFESLRDVLIRKETYGLIQSAQKKQTEMYGGVRK
ncbi:MAG: CDC/Septin GTPase family protein [Amphiamblys sp. WSBS2006]|nr:MAG: CDC/Septin GTPase family protein [Amphiamblys sp. WSBS2006]